METAQHNKKTRRHHKETSIQHGTTRGHGNTARHNKKTRRQHTATQHKSTPTKTSIHARQVDNASNTLQVQKVMADIPNQVTPPFLYTSQTDALWPSDHHKAQKGQGHQPVSGDLSQQQKDVGFPQNMSDIDYANHQWISANTSKLHHHHTPTWVHAPMDAHPHETHLTARKIYNTCMDTYQHALLVH